MLVYIGLTRTFISVDEDTEDCEVLACVILQKPEVLEMNSSFVLTTTDGTALGIWVIPLCVTNTIASGCFVITHVSDIT